LAFVWAVVALVAIIDSSIAYTHGNAAISLLIMFAGGYVSWRVVARSRVSLLTPLPLLFTFVALIFGFGPLVYFFQPDSIYVTANFRIPLDASDVFRVQVLNLLGLSSLALGLSAAASFTLQLCPESMSSRRLADERSPTSVSTKYGPSRFDDKSLLRGYLAFTAIAVILRGSERIWGINLLDSIPGFLNAIDKVGWVAVLFGAVLAGRKGGIFWLLLSIPLSIEVVEGFLRLGKSMILIPFVFSFLGLYLGGRRLRVLVIGVVLSVGTFVSIYPLINAGRNVVWSDGEGTSFQYYSDRLSNGSAPAAQELDVWMAWSRFNYTPIQHALMQEYEVNRGGDTFSQLYWMFIPRFMASEKPILDFGARVTDVIFGHRNSSTGTTIFGEAYWNGGWPYVAWSAFLAGMILFFVSLTCLWLFDQPSIVAWPIGFGGILTGLLLQNFFTSGLVATSVSFFCLSFLIRFVPKPRVRAHRKRVTSLAN
jgi:hypothetical protein